MAQSRFDLILHPIRLRIMHVIERGGHITLHELERHLPGVARDAMAQHIDLLVEGGVVEVTAASDADRSASRYRLVKANANITETEVRLATPADHLRYFTTFVAGMIEMYSRYLKRPEVDLVADGVELRQELLYLSRDEVRDVVREFQARLDELARNRPDPERSPRVFSWIIMPEVTPGEGSSPSGRE
jgi:DNA-binding transcriptional ArsR family regulator